MDIVSDIKNKIEKNIPDSTALVMSPDNIHFEVEIISSSFEGKTLIERHRIIYKTLNEDMGQIHALTIKAYTPNEKGIS